MTTTHDESKQMNDPFDAKKIKVIPPSESLTPISEVASVMAIIERVATDPAIDISRLERLMDMHARIAANAARSAYDAALSDMQPELPIIKERGRIEVREKIGGERTGKIQQSTSYALWEDINEQISPVLAKHGFSLSFRTGLHADGRIIVTGILGHKAGHREETTMVLPHDSTGSKNAVQAVGSSTSYGKRYTACALLNISSRGEDDDGKTAITNATLNEEQINAVRNLIVQVAADIPKFCKYMKVDKIDDISQTQYKRAIDALNLKKGSKGAKA